MTKKGNQQSRKAPTTIPSVLAAFFWRRNLNILADKPVLLPPPENAVAVVVTVNVGPDDAVVVTELVVVVLEGRLDDEFFLWKWCTRLFFLITGLAVASSLRSLASSLFSGGGEVSSCCCCCCCCSDVCGDERQFLLFLLREEVEDRSLMFADESKADGRGTERPLPT